MPKTKSMTQAQSFAESVSINDLNYVLLKRKDRESNKIPPLHPRDQFAIFAMLDKFLGGDGFLSEKSQFWNEDSAVAPLIDDQKFEKMLASMRPIQEDRREKWTLIVFSETFFFDESCDDDEIEKFLRFCRLLTSKYQKAVVSVNFLHKYDGKSSTFSRRTPMSKDFISGERNEALLRNKSSNFRFSNCSLIIWNGVPISCYRKTTYTDECENLVSSGYGYDFGDFKSYPTPELSVASADHKEFAKLFNSGRKQIIAARTCSDIAFTSAPAKHIKLLLLTADDSPGEKLWKKNVGAAIVCVSDAKRGCFFIGGGEVQLAREIKVAPFVWKELYCAFTENQRDIENEVVDVGCCF